MKTRLRLVSIMTVARVEERHDRRWISGAGETAVHEKISRGWWIVTADPNPIAVSVGAERPRVSAGAEMTVVLEVPLDPPTPVEEKKEEAPCT